MSDNGAGEPFVSAGLGRLIEDPGGETGEASGGAEPWRGSVPRSFTGVGTHVCEGPETRDVTEAVVSLGGSREGRRVWGNRKGLGGEGCWVWPSV